jgi:hypothetical protein
MFSTASTELESKSEEKNSCDGCATLALVEQRCENHWPSHAAGEQRCARTIGADTHARLLEHAADATTGVRCLVHDCRCGYPAISPYQDAMHDLKFELGVHRRAGHESAQLRNDYGTCSRNDVMP